MLVNLIHLRLLYRNFVHIPIKAAIFPVNKCNIQTLRELYYLPYNKVVYGVFASS